MAQDFPERSVVWVKSGFQFGAVLPNTKKRLGAFFVIVLSSWLRPWRVRFAFRVVLWMEKYLRRRNQQTFTKNSPLWAASAVNQSQRFISLLWIELLLFRFTAPCLFECFSYLFSKNRKKKGDQKDFLSKKMKGDKIFLKKITTCGTRFFENSKKVWK